MPPSFCEEKVDLLSRFTPPSRFTPFYGTDIVSALSDQFSSVFTKESDANFSVGEPLVQKSLEELDLSLEVICQSLRDINPNKAAGPDEIYGRILHDCADVLALPLLVIFRSSLMSSEVHTC